MSTYHLTGHEMKGGDMLLTFRVEPSRFARLYGAKEKTEQYIGDCTVWHSYPGFKRCGILTEKWLSEIWEKITHERRLGTYEVTR